ncbi:MAG: hypothetical protein ACR2LV_03775 [Solirubrobacteraceae bacterium]
MLLLLGTGLALRTALMASYRPGFLGHPDARTYIIAAHGPLFWNPYRPAGYPLMLRGLRRLDGRLSFTIGVQHALGLATALVAQAITARFVRRGRAALLPLAVVLGGGTQLFLEHSVLSEAPYTFLLSIALWCSAHSIDNQRPLPWLAGAGGALGVSSTLRSSGVLGIPWTAAWAATRPARRTQDRVASVAVILLGAAVPLAAYLVPQRVRTGCWGLTRTSGFTLYARMAPIADCRRSAPPAGTAALCESRPPAGRPTPTWYMFAWPEAPALRLYGAPPYPLGPAEHAAYRWAGEEPLRRFARSVLVHQPADYLRSILVGVANFVVPHTGRPSVIEWDHVRLIEELRNAGWERESIVHITNFYKTGPGYTRRNLRALAAYGRVAKLEGWPTGALAALALAGWWLSDGADRDAAALLAGTAAWGAVSTVALLFYDARYATPLYGPLAAAAALGADRLWTRWQREA